MKFLCPSGGDHPFGVFINPGILGIAKGIRDGKVWGADNGAYTGLNVPAFEKMLSNHIPFRSTCLFVCVPDVVGNAQATLELFSEWQPKLSFWSLAFVAQDGQEDLLFPDETLFSTLFIGGSTKWKKSSGPVTCIKRAQELGKHIHVGRVNYGKRYRLFSRLSGSDEFTCDGTRLRYERTKCLLEWAEFEKLPEGTD